MRNIIWDTHHRINPNGRVHLSSQVLHLDTHQPIYRRPRQRRTTFTEFMLQFTFCIVLPVLAFVFFALALVGLIWVILTIGRIVSRIGGGLS